MRFEIVIDDEGGTALGSTPWQASVMEVDEYDQTRDLGAIGYGSTPEAAANAAVEEWKEKQHE